MKHLANAVFGLLLALSFGVEAHAQTSTANTIVVEQPWARATPGGAKTGAAYMTLKNNGASADRLLSATTSVAEKVQFHKMTSEGGVSRMQEMPNVNLEPGAQVVFQPGGMHMMLVELKQPLKEGQTLSITLQFEKGESIAATVPIEKVGAMGPGHMGSMTDMPNHMMGK